MKKILCFIMSILVLLISFSISINAVALDDDDDILTTGSHQEGDILCGDYYYRMIDEETIMITEYIGHSNHVAIPDSLDGYRVVGLGGWGGSSFGGDFASVALPNSLEWITGYAFNGARIDSISIPAKVNSIQYGALKNIKYSIYVSSDNANYADIDGVLFNKNCTELLEFPSGRTGEYIIPEGVTSIFNSVFTNCSLERITFRGNLYCENLSFSKSTNLKSITIDCNGEIEINADSFMNCYSLEEINIIDTANITSLYSVDGVLFSNKTNEMLYYPPKNKTVTFSVPEGVEKLCSINCDSIEVLNIPSTVTDLGQISCENLESINVSSNNQTYRSIDGVLYNKSITEMLFFPLSSTINDFIIPQSVTNADFAKNTWDTKPYKHLRSITIPKSISDFRIVTYWQVVSGSLENIYVENGNQKYYSKDGRLFSKGDKYDSIVAYPQSNRTKVFALPEGNPICQFGAVGCKYLEEVKVPASVTTIAYTFVYGEYLKRIIVDNDNPDYCDIDGVLYSKDKKTLIRYPRGKTDSTYLFPNEIEAFEELAIWGNPYLTNLTIPDNITSLRLAIYSCDNLREITIPKNVTEIRGLGWSCTDPRGHGTYTKYDDLVIKGFTNSVAESYAREEGFQFVGIGKANKLLGDTDGDDSVTIVDATVIQRHLAEIPTAVYIEAAADADQDGQVTILDATAIQRWLAQLPVYEGIGKIFV